MVMSLIKKQVLTRDLQNSPPFERLVCFYVAISGNFERFQNFIFETDFLENENLTQKMGYCFLVESTKIENASSRYKTAISEVPYVKTNRMVSTKWTYHKGRSFCQQLLFYFFKNFVSF